MKKHFIIICTLLIVVMTSCSKEEGYGGLATIQGKVYGKDFNSHGALVSEGYVGDMKVYISKHDNPNYFDKVDTSYDGSYKFEYLQKGTYDVWVFGDCDSCAWAQVFAIETVEITSKRETVEVDDLVITF
ncbi:MAG TPA: hypothetical protein PK218_05220 [Flavobacterium sp.]|jgi:hypothetical protein|uniref:hypothetical protein n=1 Tax=Flavobacterium sp. TaxID=239 RepID=UPI002BE8F689|nr:hypothetical protein [Flavobacterium sp.]MCA0347818.1 hypothetical protein [Bacteroidota bacterium]HPW97941.1 hypothetical protein [Flavobacterium sp.]HQA74081.1 hypothetical protein [Flavobacterium sp.]